LGAYEQERATRSIGDRTEASISLKTDDREENQNAKPERLGSL